MNKGIKWHPSNESPGKKRFVGAFIKQGRDERKMTFLVIRFFQNDIKPCEIHETDENGNNILCVAWTEYKEFIEGITPSMVADAKQEASAWWKEKKD